MGKGERGKNEAAIQTYGQPGFQGSQNLAGATNTFFTGGTGVGGPATAGGRTRTAVRRSGRPGLPRTSIPGTINTAPNASGTFVPSGNTDYPGIIRGLIGNRPLDVNTLRAIEPQLSQYGMRYIWNADGTRPDIILPDGTQIDFVSNLGGAPGTQRFQWMPVGSHGGGSSVRGFSGGVAGPSGIGGNAFFSNPVVAGGLARALQDYGNIQSQFQGFADSGGYSPEDLSNIRARAVSPIRSVYSSARRDVDRQRALQGGYSPNRTAALAKMAREQSYATADASTNVESAIAQMVNQGKRFGLSGMAGLYGATPGIANMLGNQALQAANISGSHALGAQGLLNNMGLGLIQAQLNASQLPGGFETTLGRIGQIGGAVFPFVSALSDREAKEDIKPAPKILTKLKKLPIYTWKYKGDKTRHIGPMAQDFFKSFGGSGGDKMIHGIDVMGVTLGALKELAEGVNATN